MKPNADITIYHRYTDSATRMDAYTRTVYRGVYVFDCKAANVSKSGLADADSVKIHLKETDLNVSEGDFIALGICETDISSDYPIKQLQKDYRCIVVTKVDVKSYGNRNLRHTEIGGGRANGR